MKYMIASDIHGSYYYSKKMMDAFFEEKADKLILLGDILYHGPRNDLPLEYEPKKVIELLNKNKDSICAIRGNCDTEVDQMVLEFPCMADYSFFIYENSCIYFTHGHNFNEEKPLPMKNGDVMLFGHTHIPKIIKANGNAFLNPGSVSIPKGDSSNSYIIFEKGVFICKSFEGNTIFKYELGE